MDGRPTHGPLHRSLAVRLVLPGLIIVIAIAGHVVASKWGERREEARVTEHAEHAAEHIANRIGQYGDALYGIRGLFAASDEVTHEEFHDTTGATAIDRRFPGVRVIGFAPLIPADGIAARQRALDRSARESGLGYPALELPTAGAAGRIAPIAYVDPVSGNTPELGLDFLADPARRAAVEQTLRTGLPRATAPVRLPHEPGRETGFLVMLAARAPDDTELGIAYAAFRMGELVDRVLPPAERDAAIELYDLGPSTVPAAPLDAARLTYDEDKRRDAIARWPPPNGSETIEFDVLGRRWALFYAPDHELLPDDQTLLDWLPLVGGLLLAVLAFWVLSLSHRTERRAVALAESMTESLRHSQTDLARSNAELERFAYVASHDLREPLRTITGFLGLLSRRYRDRLDDDGREFVDLAVGGAKRMDALIAELLEYSRVGRGETAPEPTDLEAAWGVAVRNLSGAIVESGAVVTHGPLPVVMADRGEMVQVLQNLLGNAIKYRRGDRPPAIRVSAVPRGAHWEVSVQDDGPGIDPRHHDRIFVLLQRLHRHDEVEGTGMGLAICKKIVESHDGRIWVDSAEGHGARFTFALPAVHDAPPRARHETPPVAAAA